MSFVSRKLKVNGRLRERGYLNVKSFPEPYVFSISAIAVGSDNIGISRCEFKSVSENC